MKYFSPFNAVLFVLHSKLYKVEHIYYGTGTHVSFYRSFSVPCIGFIVCFMQGRVVEIYGPEASGKTTLGLHVIAEAQKQGGDSV